MASLMASLIEASALQERRGTLPRISRSCNQLTTLRDSFLPIHVKLIHRFLPCGVSRLVLLQKEASCTARHAYVVQKGRRGSVVFPAFRE